MKSRMEKESFSGQIKTDMRVTGRMVTEQVKANTLGQMVINMKGTGLILKWKVMELKPLKMVAQHNQVTGFKGCLKDNNNLINIWLLSRLHKFDSYSLNLHATVYLS